MTPSLPQVAQIVRVVDESPQVRTLAVDLSMTADPGQFVMAWLPGLDEKPFSLVHDNPVTLTIARVGPFSSAVHRLGVGDRLWLRGPLGQPFLLPPIEAGQPPVGGTSHPALLLVAGGYGVAPLHFLAERARALGWEVWVVIGAQSAADVILADRFAALGAQVRITTEDGSWGEPGLATDAVERLVQQTHFQSLYACGPEPMLEAVERLARRCGLPAQLSYERYMRCGFGVCGSCSRQGWLVCRDGPVRHVLIQSQEDNP